ncbi:hypothetical protein [Kitasatospora sp. NBC_01266]|uniref:hypothetical protein n=1 Tax=Kitasatospora sp. NBC_01266 TaxID=2903572 RepID=UPI002E329011|nr:hypothetical protein [Kitasatospora sp. NBC_01266]
MATRKPPKALLISVALTLLVAVAIVLISRSSETEPAAAPPATAAPTDGSSGDDPSIAPAPDNRPTLTFSSLDGPVTPAEIASFTSYIETLTPSPDNDGNAWAQGHSGEDVKAMGLVYEVSGNRAVLDRMIDFCDTVLSERDDLAPAPVGQHVLWTGRIDPAWPAKTNAKPIITGGEQGDPVGHLADCARLILQTPAIWKLPVTIGDPHGYGATYLDRAKKFVAEADTAVDGHILARLLDLSHGNRQYFAADSPYKGGQPVPWNQQMMFDYGFQNLAIDHQILGDDPTRVSKYDNLVQTSIDWFFADTKPYTDKAGNTAYDWYYAPSAGAKPTGDKEDNNHGSLDCAGLYRAYLSGRYHITPAMLAPIANTFVDVMATGHDHYAGRIDGSTGVGNGSATHYARSGWLLMTEFRPNAYQQLVTANFPRKTTTADDQFSRVLMLRSRRDKQQVSPTP